MKISIRKLPTFHYSLTDFLNYFFFVQHLQTKITTSTHNDIKDNSVYGWQYIIYFKSYIRIKSGEIMS